ncbi:hypothetical protein ONS95_004861 [Cadophora gregata]|uniref:uncharacterized protein n=1 Tax=Cadophora gregata TaxID=51156 RepID=UPI0026DD3977|nr:uncharacterized protein ONS95_004861 [Cadophora gregata]KAK0104575.1 hypothetical protein ONS95_004861 [Cadophora gregata]KAK0115336.1 hypothetical protein ONS96_013795 [Cadophora gregata f. sp. sojae]
MNHLTTLLALLLLITSSIAASPPSFCKCTCFTNSTIIPLSSHTSTNPSLLRKHPQGNPPVLNTRATSASCLTCNKAFCLSQRLPICKDAEEKDVLTTCFQRDSRKDQIVVLTFIAGTLGLLGWAAVRKVLEGRKSEGVRIGDGNTASAGTYAPVGR